MSRDVAAVVVAYGSGEHLPACLASLRGKVAEAVVVDNGAGSSAPPALRAEHARVDWIDNDGNRGFAAAANQGAAATESPYVLFLNPDCELLTDLDALIAACAMPGVAGAGGLLVDADGAPQTGFYARSLPTGWALACEALGVNRIWRRNPANRRYRLLDADPSVAREVGQPAGAMLAVRREAFAAVGGFDERFHPAWWEDVDLCRRLRDAGHSLRFTPRCVARHAGGHSVNALPPGARLQAWYGGLLRYSEKHLPRGTHRSVRLAVLTGLALRSLHCRLGGSAPGAAGAYRAAIRQVRAASPMR